MYLGIGIDAHQGGIIFWLRWKWLEGLIAAPTDQSSGANLVRMGCYGTLFRSMEQLLEQVIKTQLILKLDCTTPGTAADICANLTLGGYSDWFLPSKDELNEMYLNIGQQAWWFWANFTYWSSTEDGTTQCVGSEFLQWKPVQHP